MTRLAPCVPPVYTQRTPSVPCVQQVTLARSQKAVNSDLDNINTNNKAVQ